MTSSAAAASSAVAPESDNNDNNVNLIGLIGLVNNSKSNKMMRKEKRLAYVAATTGPVAPGLTEMSDPAEDSNCIELGKIVFGVRAVKGQTLQGIIERLSSNGFYAKKGSAASSAVNSAFGEALCLQNVFEKKFLNGYYGKSKAAHLKVTFKLGFLPPFFFSSLLPSLPPVL